MDSIETNNKYKEEKRKQKASQKQVATVEKMKNKSVKRSGGVLIPKRKPKTKTQTTATLKKKKRKELLLRAKKVVYARDKDICQHCDKKCVGSDRHASHVIPVSATGRLALYPLNMKVLCYHCHLNRRHKNPIEAGRWFANKFPDRLQELERIASEIGMGSITLTELEEIERIIEKDEKKYYI